MAWVKVAAAAAVPDGGMLGIEVEGTPIALYRIDGAIYATQGLCTHAVAFLHEGWVDGGTIECPLHQGRFDIRTGRPLCSPVTRALRTYDVRVAGDDLLLNTDAAEPAATGDAPPRALPSAGRVVIVGAGQAAAAAIRALRGAGYRGRIDLVGAEAHLPYERPPLSKAFLLPGDPAPCPGFTAADIATLDVHTHLGVRATAVDAAVKSVRLEDGRVLPYDSLLLATGGHARGLGVPGEALPGVFRLRTQGDALAIRQALDGARTVGIIGGGFIGLELASAAVTGGRTVTLIERQPELMARLLPRTLGEAFRTRAEQHGVRVLRDHAVERIERVGDRLRVTTNRQAVDFDIVLVGAGLELDLTLAESAGCAVAGGIVVDAVGRTSVPGIWAAGDCALHPEPVAGRRIRLESWHNAEETGARAGLSIAGQPPATPVKRPWFWTDQFGANIQLVGMPAVTDAVAVENGVYHCYDPATLRLTATMAVANPAAIRAARVQLDAGACIDPPVPPATSEDAMNLPEPLRARFAWPAVGLSRIPDWVYTDPEIYAREVERIFHGKTWNYVALEAEIPLAGDYIRSNVGPTPVVVSRAEDGTIHVFENRCAHRAAEFCRTLTGNVTEFVCPYHQWTYDLRGNLAGVPFRRGVNGKGGMPADFNAADHGLRRLAVTTHRGVVFASYAHDTEPFAEYLGEEVLREFEATFDGRKLVVLGHYRHSLPGNWKLYHENLRDPYHATLLHTFLVTFGLLVAGNKSLMLTDPTGRHGVMASAKSDAVVSADNKKEMRAYQEGMTLAEPRFMDFVPEFDSPWSVTMSTIWPNLVVQREMNTLGIRQIVPTGPNEFIMKWTMFGFEGDDAEMTRHRLRQGNLMGPAGFLGLEDNEAIKFVQDGMLNVPGGEHLVALDPEAADGTTDSLISESCVRAMYKHWRQAMDL
jgi:phenylpropionate dioxygenase-like ring-hydroxylating dioxygenase large terminal subunit/NADPH-dependent 2,4-dienoyl-CoA reductase/sulfur reductase-like enzyme